MTDKELIAQIEANIANLSDNDRGFAHSMIANVYRYGSATEKQRYWLDQLAKRAIGEQPADRVKTAVGGLEGMMALFNKAKAHLKSPAIVIGLAGEELRLSVAGPTARVPGSINVNTNSEWDDRKWFGRILESGEFEASPREPTPDGLIDGLKRFAAEPAKVAAEHGRLTGRCCFCNRGLTDERSTAVGYGKTCASNFGLAYPSLSEARAAHSEDLFSETESTAPSSISDIIILNGVVMAAA